MWRGKGNQPGFSIVPNFSQSFRGLCRLFVRARSVLPVSTRGTIDGLPSVNQLESEIQGCHIDEPAVSTLKRKGRLGELLHKFGTLRNRKWVIKHDSTWRGSSVACTFVNLGGIPYFDMPWNLLGQVNLLGTSAQPSTRNIRQGLHGLCHPYKANPKENLKAALHFGSDSGILWWNPAVRLLVKATANRVNRNRRNRQ